MPKGLVIYIVLSVSFVIVFAFAALCIYIYSKKNELRRILSKYSYLKEQAIRKTAHLNEMTQEKDKIAIVSGTTTQELEQNYARTINSLKSMQRNYGRVGDIISIHEDVSLSESKDGCAILIRYKELGLREDVLLECYEYAEAAVYFADKQLKEFCDAYCRELSTIERMAALGCRL